jgi:hypothetical protein
MEFQFVKYILVSSLSDVTSLGPGGVGFVVDKVAMRQVFCEYFGFS